MSSNGDFPSNNQHIPDSVLELLVALQNQIRLEILAQLSRTELSVTKLAEELDLDGSTVSHALARLRKCGLVQHRSEQKSHIYKLSELVRAEIDDDRTAIQINDGLIEISIKFKRQSPDVI